jgi:CelD/BcsL family acetyltransferase involved in cellulose biosynthesis
LVAELIRRAIDNGCRRFDMLKGDLGYKYRFGAEPRRIVRLLLSRPNRSISPSLPA